MTDIIWETREKIAELGQLMFDRFLTDTAGGNISVRVGNLFCITARHCGSKFRWRIRPEQVIVADFKGNKLEGDGDLSREAKVHLKLLTDFPDSNSVVHCHPRNVMVFAMTCQPILPILEGTLKLGTIKVAKFAPAHSAHLSENIAKEFLGQEERVRKYAAAVIAPYHGLFVLGKDLDTAFDAAERIEVSAHCLLSAHLFQPASFKTMQEASSAIVQEISSFEE